MAFDEKLFGHLIKNSDFEFDHLYFKSIDSTNEYAKRHDFDKTTVIISSEQYKGKGRLGRQFISEKDKGVYFSIVEYGLTHKQISMLTIAAGVCVCEVLEEECKKDFSIKWVNDILFDGKKVCGILVENTVDESTKSMQKSVIGIGINLYKNVDESICDIASSVEYMTSKKLLGERVVFKIVNKLEQFLKKNDKANILDIYRKKCITCNRDVIVNTFSKVYPAFALGIDDEGHLLVEAQGRTFALNSGEVSVLPKIK